MEKRAAKQIRGKTIAPIVHDGEPVTRRLPRWDEVTPMSGWAAAAVAAQNEGLSMELIDRDGTE